MGGWKDSPTCRHNLDPVTYGNHMQGKLISMWSPEKFTVINTHVNRLFNPRPSTAHYSWNSIFCRNYIFFIYSWWFVIRMFWYDIIVSMCKFWLVKLLYQPLLLHHLQILRSNHPPESSFSLLLLKVNSLFPFHFSLSEGHWLVQKQIQRDVWTLKYPWYLFCQHSNSSGLNSTLKSWQCSFLES